MRKNLRRQKAKSLCLKKRIMPMSYNISKIEYSNIGELLYSGELDNGPASASIYPTVAAGSVENPVTTTITVKASLAKGAHAINSATVCVEGKVPGSSPVYITSDQNLNYSAVNITLDSGITLGL